MRFPRSIVASVAALLLAGCGAFRTGAAVVNGEVISEDRFRRQVDFLLSDPRFAQQAPGEQGEGQREEFARQFLTFLIHQELVRSFAEANNIQPSEDEVRAELQAQIEALGGQPAFEAQLQETGATVGEVENLIREQVLRREVADAVIAKEVTESELRQDYEDRLIAFTTARVAHILVSSKGPAQKIAKKATPGTFAELARKFSDDTGSARRGGYIGRQSLANLTPNFAEVVLGTPVGQIGGPVKTEFGWHLIWVREKEKQPFSEVRPQLLAEARGQVFTNWLLDRIAGAEVRVNPRYGTFDQERGQVVERTATSPSPPPVQVNP